MNETRAAVIPSTKAGHGWPPTIRHLRAGLPRRFLSGVCAEARGERKNIGDHACRYLGAIAIRRGCDRSSFCCPITFQSSGFHGRLGDLAHCFCHILLRCSVDVSARATIDDERAESRSNRLYQAGCCTGRPQIYYRRISRDTGFIRRRNAKLGGASFCAGATATTSPRRRGAAQCVCSSLGYLRNIVSAQSERQCWRADVQICKRLFERDARRIAVCTMGEIAEYDRASSGFQETIFTTPARDIEIAYRRCAPTMSKPESRGDIIGLAHNVCYSWTSAFERRTDWRPQAQAGDDDHRKTVRGKAPRFLLCFSHGKKCPKKSLLLAGDSFSSIAHLVRHQADGFVCK